MDAYLLDEDDLALLKAEPEPRERDAAEPADRSMGLLALELRALAKRPLPCDGCAWRPRCAAEPIACRAYLTFVHNAKWDEADRGEPDENTFRQAMRA